MLLLMQLLTPVQSANIDLVITCSAADCSLNCAAVTDCKHRGHSDCLQQSRLFFMLYCPSLALFVLMGCNLQSKFVRFESGWTLLDLPALL